MCEFGSFNLLACQCFSDVQCKIYCGKTRRTDPVDGCTCISDAEYRAYFPDWATEKDIDYSWKIQFERFQVLANTFESQEIRHFLNESSPVYSGPILFLCDLQCE